MLILPTDPGEEFEVKEEEHIPDPDEKTPLLPKHNLDTNDETSCSKHGKF